MSETSSRGTCLRWCVNPSFDEYVRTSAADGRIETSDGAEVTADATYLFPADAERSTEGVEAYRGTVTHTAYFGVLDVRISSPRLEIDGDATRVLVRDTSSADDGWGEFGRVETAPLSRGENVAVRLSRFGSELFMNEYPVDGPLGLMQIVSTNEQKDR